MVLGWLGSEVEEQKYPGKNYLGVNQVLIKSFQHISKGQNCPVM